MLNAFEQRPWRKGPVGLIAMLFVIIAMVFGVILRVEYEQTRSEAARTIGSISAAVAADFSRNIELLDLSIQEVVIGWSDDEVRALKPDLRQKVLFDHAATAHDFGPLLVLDRYGSLLATSASTAVPVGSYADREEFRAQAGNGIPGLFVSRPFQAEPDGEWSLAFSRRLVDSDGQFNGIVSGTLRLSYFEDTYRRIHLGPGSALSLFTADNTLVVREPAAPSGYGGRGRQSVALARDPDTDVGLAETVSPIDGVERISGYQRVGTLPLFQYVSLSKSEVFAKFWSRTLVIGIVLAALLLCILVLLTKVERELRQREAAELKLSELASKDELTGLDNRRVFNAALEREWTRSHDQAARVALMIVDVDHFKAFNDSYGHLAGDAVLKRIATIIAEAARRHGGLGCRYGGEEFVVLLSQFHSRPALAVAEEIRMAISDLRQAHRGSPHERVTASIGVASGQMADLSSADLIALADAELYRMKATGRNRSSFSEKKARLVA